MREKNKGFTPIIVLIVVLLAAAIAGAYYLGTKNSTVQTGIPTSSGTPDPTTNWKTYTNAQLGFSFKYPDSYFKFSQEFPDAGVYLAPSKGNMVGPAGLNPTDLWIDMTVSSGANLTSLDQFLNLQGQGNMYLNVQKEKVTMGGVSGYKITRNNVPGNITTSNYEGIVLQNGSLYHLILSSQQNDTLVKNQSLFDQILSTFKFNQ